MNLEDVDYPDHKKIEKKLAIKLFDTVSTMNFTNAKDAFYFFKNEIKSLQEKYPDYLLIEEVEDDLILGFVAEDKRINLDDVGRQLYIHFKSSLPGYDKRFEVKVGTLSNVYKCVPLNSRLGFMLMEESNKKDNFDLNGVPINNLLLATFLDKISIAIHSFVFATTE